MCDTTKETSDAYNNKWVKRDLEQLRNKILELQAKLDKQAEEIEAYEKCLKGSCEFCWYLRRRDIKSVECMKCKLEGGYKWKFYLSKP